MSSPSGGCQSRQSRSCVVVWLVVMKKVCVWLLWEPDVQDGMVFAGVCNHPTQDGIILRHFDVVFSSWWWSFVVSGGKRGERREEDALGGRDGGQKAVRRRRQTDSQ